MIENLPIEALHTLVQKAGKAILSVYHESSQNIQLKSDSSPVTRADLLSNTILYEGLSSLPNAYPILSEESPLPSSQERASWQCHWLIDPLDGTKEFIDKNGEFSINIALMEGKYPLWGMVHIPMCGTTYWGGKTLGAFVVSAHILPARD